MIYEAEIISYLGRKNKKIYDYFYKYMCTYLNFCKFLGLLKNNYIPPLILLNIINIFCLFNKKENYIFIKCYILSHHVILVFNY